MVIDYKDVSFSFKARRRKRLKKRLAIVSVVILVVFLYLMLKLFLDSEKIEDIESLLLQSNLEQAAALFNDIENSLFHGDSKRELKALLHLFNDEFPQAEQTLKPLAGRSTSIAFQKFLDHFLDHARYMRLKIYTDYLLAKGEEVRFYKIVYQTAYFEHEQAAALMRALPPEISQENEKALKIVARTNREAASGKINYIFDVNGKPLAYWDIAKKNTVSLTPGLAFAEFDADFNGELKYYKLTIDRTIQEQLQRLFRNLHGTFLLLDLSDNSIAAAYSKPVKKESVNAVFHETYQPASIIKVLTLFAHLMNGKSKIFPFHCKGKIELGSKTFYDWWAHDKVKSYKEALAVSCNLAFARMGIDLGMAKLAKILEKFYFNGAPFSDRFLTFSTGTFSADIPDDYHMARVSVGLNSITTTTCHSALVSAIIAQNGTIYAPHMIKNIKNLLNLGFYNHQARLISVMRDNLTFLKIKEAMAEVVTSPRGTGRRARVDFVQTAVKTGTIGDHARGYDAILTGFFPAKRPRYAFAFRLQRAGKAETVGARFLKDFLLALYNK